ncbi:MAG: hypothetical protein RBR86_05235 [Pseudobdellovibrionaceae bacterium]|jgi:hypothetical protein|nr:hypothetical protein [Pseudobdellovibrionaceae bacterium]
MGLSLQDISIGDSVFAQLGQNVSFASNDPGRNNSGRIVAHAADAAGAQWGAEVAIENSRPGLCDSFGQAGARTQHGAFVQHGMGAQMRADLSL